MQLCAERIFLDNNGFIERAKRMTVDYYYNVGGFIFSVSLPQGTDVGSLLPSFNPFRCEAVQPEQCLFRITAQEHPQVPSVLGGDLLDESVNDLGYTSLFAVSDVPFHICRSYGVLGGLPCRQCFVFDDSYCLFTGGSASWSYFHSCFGCQLFWICLSFYGQERDGEEHSCSLVDEIYTGYGIIE